MTTDTTTTPATPKFATRDQYELAIQNAGLSFTEQSGFLKVEAAKGRRVYVAATKTVRRIDLSGFELSSSLAKVPHCGIFGQVKQQMRLDGTPEEQVARFVEVLAELVKLPAVEKAPKPPKAKKVKGEKKGWGAKPVASPEVETDEARAKRIALIKEYAQKHGVAVSNKSIASASDSE